MVRSLEKGPDLATLIIDFVIHVSLCGALNQNFDSGDIFIFDQLIDYTNIKAEQTF